MNDDMDFCPLGKHFNAGNVWNENPTNYASGKYICQSRVSHYFYQQETACNVSLVKYQISIFLIYLC